MAQLLLFTVRGAVVLDGTWVAPLNWEPMFHVLPSAMGEHRGGGRAGLLLM